MAAMACYKNTSLPNLGRPKPESEEILVWWIMAFAITFVYMNWLMLIFIKTNNFKMFLQLLVIYHEYIIRV